MEPPHLPPNLPRAQACRDRSLTQGPYRPYRPYRPLLAPGGDGGEMAARWRGDGGESAQRLHRDCAAITGGREAIGARLHEKVVDLPQLLLQGSPLFAQLLRSFERGGRRCGGSRGPGRGGVRGARRLERRLVRRTRVRRLAARSILGRILPPLQKHSAHTVTHAITFLILRADRVAAPPASRRRGPW